jgi:hypothetical protein
MRGVLPWLAGLALACTVAAPLMAGTVERLRPRWVSPKPLHTGWRQGWRQNLIVLKFAEGSGVRLRNGQLVSLNGASLQGLRQVFLNHGQPAVRRMFSRPEPALDQERAAGQQISGNELADLNLYYLLVPVTGGDPRLLVDDLNALPVVELSYFEPLAQRAVIHQAPDRSPDEEIDAWRATPDFSGLQDYLQPAPLGLDAGSAWDFPGGLGQGVRIGLVERGLNPDHEDLPLPENWIGKDVNLDHGTAVLGEILGQHNGFGIMGISPEARLQVSIFETAQPFPVIADAISALGPHLAAGDVMLIEYHALGPPSGENCSCSCQSFEYVPLEYWQANFDVIASATANQVICVEIAGNGSMNLDHPRYGGVFDRTVRDSGAILVGAAIPGSRKPSCWTNYGSRLDLHGHGSQIVTAGYGPLFNGGPNAKYTDWFGGTSGAGAMTAGAVCAFQGWYKARTGIPLSPADLLARLRQTGTPQAADPRRIGPFPDLYAAIHGPRPVIPGHRL